MNRRGFLGSILTACVAPAIVRADSLMRVVPREVLVLEDLEYYEDYIYIDQSRKLRTGTEILQLQKEGLKVWGAALFAAQQKKPGLADFIKWGAIIEVDRP